MHAVTIGFLIWQLLFAPFVPDPHPQILRPILYSSVASASWGAITQHPKGSSATHTCSVTLSATGASSELDIVLITHNFFTSVGNAVTFVSATDSASDIFQATPSASGQVWDSGSFVWESVMMARVPHVSSGVTSVSITTQGTLGTLTSICYGIETPYSGGTPALNASLTIESGTACTNCAGAVPTLAGSNNLAVQIIDTDGTPSAVASGPFASPAFSDFDATFAHSGIVAAINTTSSTAPTWTNTSGVGVRVGIYIGFAVTPCVDYGVEDFTGGTAGSAPTATTLLGNGTSTGLLGDIGYNYNNSTGTTFTVTSTGNKYATVSAPSMANVPRFCSGGAFYTDTSPTVMQYSSTGATTSFITFLAPNPSAPILTGQVSSVIWFETSYAGTDSLTLEDIFFPHSSSGSPDFMGHEVRINGGNLQICFEAGAAGSFGPGSNCTTISANTWYQLSVTSQFTASFTGTFSNGSAVISGANTFGVGSIVYLTTSGTLPTGFAISTPYCVSPTGLSATQFELSSTVTESCTGSVITAGSAGSGTQTAVPGHKAAIFTSTASQVGTTFTAPSVSGASFFAETLIGPSTAFTGTTARTMNFGKMKTCYANGSTTCTSLLLE